MKKMYVKPQATNVAFVVNENIATSVAIPVELLEGDITYTNAAAGSCNEELYGYKTGLQAGNTSIVDALNNIKNVYGIEAWDVILDMFKGN